MPYIYIYIVHQSHVRCVLSVSAREQRVCIETMKSFFLPFLQRDFIWHTEAAKLFAVTWDLFESLHIFANDRFRWRRRRRGRVDLMHSLDAAWPEMHNGECGNKWCSKKFSGMGNVQEKTEVVMSWSLAHITHSMGKRFSKRKRTSIILWLCLFVCLRIKYLNIKCVCERVREYTRSRDRDATIAHSFNFIRISLSATYHRYVCSIPCRLLHVCLFFSLPIYIFSIVTNHTRHTYYLLVMQGHTPNINGTCYRSWRLKLLATLWIVNMFPFHEHHNSQRRRCAKKHA